MTEPPCARVNAARSLWFNDAGRGLSSFGDGLTCRRIRGKLPQKWRKSAVSCGVLCRIRYKYHGKHKQQRSRGIMERAEKAARELREGLEKARQVVADHRKRMKRLPAGETPAATTGDAAAVAGEG